MFHITDLNTTGIKLAGPEIRLERDKFLSYTEKFNKIKNRDIQNGTIKNVTKEGTPMMHMFF